MINDFIIFDFGLSRTVTADESAPHLVADGGGNEMTILENRGYNAAANDADLHRRPKMYEGCRKSTISSIGGEMIVEPKLRRRDDGLIESSIRLTPPLSLTPAKRPHTSYSWPATTSPPRRFESKRSPNYGLTNSPPRFEYEQENHLPMFENSNDAYLQDEALVTTTLLSDHEDDLMNLCANRSGTTGLCNLGNTCFMNAALQCLVHTSYLADFFLSRNCDIFLSDEKLGRSFAEVIENIYQNRYMTYSPDSFLREFTADNVAPQFGDGEQQDAHEFIRVLVDKLCVVMKDETRCRDNVVRKAAEEELESMSTRSKSDYRLKEHLSANSSIITDEFCGQLISTTQCTVCNEEHTCFDPFYDISLPFPERRQSVRTSQYRRTSMMSSFMGSTDLQHCTLDDCISEFTKEEVLDGDNMIECKNCCCKRVGIKRLQVSDFPNVLVLHLKRFGNTRKKVQTKVQFPINDFDASSLAYEREDYAPSPIYDLFAVCNHTGRANYGHYTACCIDPHSNSWYSFNDERVHGIIPTSDLDKAGAYILFYSLRDET